MTPLSRVSLSSLPVRSAVQFIAVRSATLAGNVGVAVAAAVTTLRTARIHTFLCSSFVVALAPAAASSSGQAKQLAPAQPPAAQQQPPTAPPQGLPSAPAPSAAPSAAAAAQSPNFGSGTSAGGGTSAGSGGMSYRCDSMHSYAGSLLHVHTYARACSSITGCCLSSEEA